MIKGTLLEAFQKASTYFDFTQLRCVALSMTFFGVALSMTFFGVVLSMTF